MLVKKTIFLLLQILFASLFASAQKNANIKYFDTENKEITEKAFKKLRSTNSVLDIIGDSTNHLKLINREENGNINDRNTFITALERVSNTKIDTNSTIIIVYYPGQDPCNSTGTSGVLTEKYKETERSAKQIAKTQTFYIYKDFKGLEKFNKSITWIKDPENLVENLFFKHHYPCGSFTVISKSGAYISYFGEYPPYYILNAVKILNN